MAEQTTDGAPSGSAARALRVFRAVVLHGPQKPDTICARTGLGRSAVHRAIHALIDEGMLRYQLGRRHVALRSDWHEDFARQSASPAALDTVAGTIETVLRGRRVQGDLAILTTQARFRIVEATDVERLDGSEGPLNSDLFIAGLSLFDPVRVLSITTAVLKAEGRGGAAPEAEFMARFREARKTGYLWEPYSRELSVPLCMSGDSALALRLWSRETTPRQCPYFQGLVEEMRLSEPGLFPAVEQRDA